jgi:hypothetical protein
LKKSFTICYLCETISQAFLHVFLYFPFFTPGKQPYFEISEMTTYTSMNRARDIWWTLDFANACLSPGVNSRAELVPSPRAYARNGAPRRWLGDKLNLAKKLPMSTVKTLVTVNASDNSTFTFTLYFKYFLRILCTFYLSTFCLQYFLLLLKSFYC